MGGEANALGSVTHVIIDEVSCGRFLKQNLKEPDLSWVVCVKCKQKISN
jgi:hypothetical protein